MAMNSFNLEYDDDERDPSSQLPSDPSYLAFPGQVGSYAYGAMLPQDSALPLQSFERSQPPDLEGRMSNVMLAYDPASGVSMPMNLDPTNAFAYDAQAYPPTTMGMGMPQFHHTYPPYHSSMPGYSQPISQARKEQYDTSTDSTVNLEDSDFSGRNSDRSQVQAPRVPRRVEKPQPASRPSQPVAIQPRKPAPLLGKFMRPASPASTDETKRTFRRGWKSPRLARLHILESTRVVALMCWGLWFVLPVLQ
jgi:hypothetical protein